MIEHYWTRIYQIVFSSPLFRWTLHSTESTADIEPFNHEWQTQSAEIAVLFESYQILCGGFGWSNKK